MLKAFIATATAIRSSLTSGLLRIAGPAAGTTRTMTVPDANFTAARTDAAQTFTGVQTVQAAATQDAVALAGRAGGTGSYKSTITPTALSASRTVTLPNADTTVPVATQVLTFSGPSAARTVTLPDANFTAARTDAAQTFTGTQVLTANTGKGTITSAASGVAQTLFDPTTIGAGVFYVVAYIASVPSASYAASAIVACGGTDAVITATNATLMTLTLSGNNVQATQGSGSTQNIQYAYFRIGH